LFHIPVLALRK